VLSTFVIGLREGLEAALIVGIVAAFLRTQGRGDRVKYVWAGVAAAVAVCVAFAVTLQVVSADLPQRQQEGLEAVIGMVAVAMVTYMIVWMRRHARDLKGHLERSAGLALASGSAWALVVMAVLAVLREGFETSVFLLAAFQASVNPLAAGFGAILGVLVACGLGYGIYRGGIKLDLARFFTVTGVLLVIVAAGLFATAFHTAHEAGWVNFGQAQALDLTWLVHPGSVTASLLTGVLGFQPKPVAIEVVAWLAYAVPMGLYVLWPTLHRRKPVATKAAPAPSPRTVSA
jgi:high-affinity iron transporter